MDEQQNLPMERAYIIAMQTGRHLFLTGKAGTGKTTFLRRLVKESPKRIAVLAPTGIAAINAGGVTIHSFFQFPFAPFVPNGHYGKEMFKINRMRLRLIRQIDMLVIDEVSMVRADLLDRIDVTLQRLRGQSVPFGGVQMLLIGDVGQLAPVATDDEWRLLQPYYETPYFFSSHVMRTAEFLTIELKQIYRQQDPYFLELLSSVRANHAGADVLQALNARVRPNFEPRPEEGYIRLVTHNRQAKTINDAELGRIEGPLSTYKAQVEGTFPETSFPTDETLQLRVGAQVMFVKNNAECGYFNGSLATVTSLSEESIKVRLHEDNREIEVGPLAWKNTHYTLNERTKEVEERVDGVFLQIPVKLAWAITIHKSQGLTFDRAIVDAHAAFSHGQTYVALSRLRSLEGLVLSTPIPPQAIITDRHVANFSAEAEAAAPTDSDVALYKRQHYLALVADLFNFQLFSQPLAAYVALVDSQHARLFPKQAEQLHHSQELFQREAVQVGLSFRSQYTRLITQTDDYATDAHLQERLRKAADYFLPCVRRLVSDLTGFHFPSDDKELKARTEAARDNVLDPLRRRLSLLRFVGEKGFELTAYQRRRAEVMAAEKPEAEKAVKRGGVPADVKNAVLYRRLVRWRAAMAEERGVPAYVVLSQKGLIAVCNTEPRNLKELANVTGIGPKTLDNFGAEIINLVNT